MYWNNVNCPELLWYSTAFDACLRDHPREDSDDCEKSSSSEVMDKNLSEHRDSQGSGNPRSIELDIGGVSDRSVVFMTAAAYLHNCWKTIQNRP